MTDQIDNVVRNAFRDLKEGVKHPYKIRRKIRNTGPSPILEVNNRHFKWKYGEGVDVMERDWDNLILLDACRYDYFDEQNHIEGDLQPVVSKANVSWEFMVENLVGRGLHDTVYVTANPFAEKLPDDTFYTIESLLDQWDPDLETIRPQDVVDAAITAHEKYPEKRLIIHFIQPHQPFLGPTAEEIRDRVNIMGINKWRTHGRDNRTGVSWWDAVKQGMVSWNETSQAYSETLDIALDHAEKLVSTFDGKSVISADHGEMLGERVFPATARRTGHPDDIYTEELCIVPWLEIDSDSRRKTIAEEPIGHKQADEKVVNERLNALGYITE